VLTLSDDFAELRALRDPPERLLRMMLLQAFYGLHSECQLMERLDFVLSKDQLVPLEKGHRARI